MRLRDILLAEKAAVPIPAIGAPDAEFESLAGEHLGSGNARNVYRHRFDPSLVVKENHQGTGNSLEWETWTMLRGTGLEHWLAPCESLSETTDYMVQRFAADCAFEGSVPLLLLMLDPYADNFGEYRGRIVARDYDWRLADLGDITGRPHDALREFRATPRLLRDFRADFDQKFGAYPVDDFIDFVSGEGAWTD